MVITFLSDFGLRDDFVGTCHGVIAGIAPDATIIDITHGIEPQAVLQGALVLANTIPYMPEGVHLAVVDPGVGSDRRALAVRDAAGRIYVGPDNGLLVPAADEQGGVADAWQLSDPRFMLDRVSRTFHGRDVFAPVAARLALGAPLAGAGPAVDPGGLVRLPPPVVARDAEGFTAEVLTVDHFGNVQLAAPAEVLGPLPAAVRVGSSGPGPARAAVRGRTFGDAPEGGLVVYVDSADLVAVAVNGGRAVDVLGVSPGDLLRVAG